MSSSAALHDQLVGGLVHLEGDGDVAAEGGRVEVGLEHEVVARSGRPRGAAGRDRRSLAERTGRPVAGRRPAGTELCQLASALVHDLDVVGIGNALVDVITHDDDAFLDAQALVKGSMTLIDTERADAASTPPWDAGSRCPAVRRPTP